MFCAAFLMFLAVPGAAGADRDMSKKAPLRTWTDNAGTHKTRERLVEVKEGSVVLEKEDGATVAVPLARLSKHDQAFARQTALPPARSPIPAWRTSFPRTRQDRSLCRVPRNEPLLRPPFWRDAGGTAAGAHFSLSSVSTYFWSLSLSLASGTWIVLPSSLRRSTTSSPSRFTNLASIV